jgi:hypothetical protein
VFTIAQYNTFNPVLYSSSSSSTAPQRLNFTLSFVCAASNQSALARIQLWWKDPSALQNDASGGGLDPITLHVMKRCVPPPINAGLNDGVPELLE